MHCMRDELPRTWDVVVVGAGVAGAISALHLARSQLRVLLVEKSRWPREKVCGGCLNAAALRALANAGVALKDGCDYTRMRLACGTRAAEFPLDRKSTRLNSSHPSISYAVFCLKKKKKTVYRM